MRISSNAFSIAPSRQHPENAYTLTENVPVGKYNKYKFWKTYEDGVYSPFGALG